ncbi:MAG: major outer membrane protein [Aliarcobacter sp.]|nr:major outer membrane protein [Aliarcobacter sp.]
MKKIAKLSLVAAVAVAGFTSANAASLEEAIKGVDISGTALYRYDDRTSDDATNANYTNNSYKIAVNLKSSINDDLTFNTRTIIGTDNSVTGNSNSSDMVDLTTNGADQNAGFALSHANFAYTGIANTTVIAGKQAVPSPFAIQADATDNESNGTGLVALVNVGPATIAASLL